MELASRFADPTVLDKNLSAEEKRTKDKLVFHELAQSEYTTRTRSGRFRPRFDADGQSACGATRPTCRS